jgi:excisionase family DNA binding protein
MDDLLSRRVASVALNSRSAKIGTPAAPSTGLPKTLKRESPERQPPPSSDHQPSHRGHPHSSASRSGAEANSGAAVSDGHSRFPRDSSADSQQLLTVNQLADRWNVHPRTIRRKIKAKKIEPIRIGRSVRIHPSVAEIGPGDTI